MNDAIMHLSVLFISGYTPINFQSTESDVTKHLHVGVFYAWA